MLCRSRSGRLQPCFKRCRGLAGREVGLADVPVPVPTGQPKDGRIDIGPKQPAVGLREYLKEGADNAAQGFEIQLVQRQPLNGEPPG